MKKPTKKNLSLAPQQVNKVCWYYENPTSITLVVEARESDGNYLKTTQVRIPHRKLLATLKRAGKKL